MASFIKVRLSPNDTVQRHGRMHVLTSTCSIHPRLNYIPHNQQKEAAHVQISIPCHTITSAKIQI